MEAADGGRGVKLPTGWEKAFVAYFYFVGWDCISAGLHVCVGLPNVEIHLPFGFIRIGWVERPIEKPYGYEVCARRTFGFDRWR